MCKALDDIYTEGIAQGIEKGIIQGIKALIPDNLEEGIPRERILEKLQKRFSLDRAKAETYYLRFSTEPEGTYL